MEGRSRVMLMVLFAGLLLLISLSTSSTWAPNIAIVSTTAYNVPSYLNASQINAASQPQQTGLQWQNFEYTKGVPQNECTSPLNGTLIGSMTKNNNMKPIPFLPNYKNPCWFEGASCKLKCLPYFMIVGVTKCGTTKMYQTMMKHHQITPANKKEICWWSSKGRKDFAAYTTIFGQAADQIQHTVIRHNHDISHPLVTYDSSPDTFYCPFEKKLSAKRIHQMLPDIFIIVTVRHPTQRLFSDYNHFTHRSPGHFDKLVKRAIQKHVDCRKTKSIKTCAYEDVNPKRSNKKVSISLGMYDIWAEEWLKVYPRNKIFFSRLDDFAVTPAKQLSEMAAFLQLEPVKQDLIDELEALTEKVHTYKIPAMFNETRQLLNEFYRPHLERFAKMLYDDKYLFNT